MKKKKSKIPRWNITPPSGKKPRREEKPEVIESEEPAWSISIIDRDGEWGWNNVPNEVLWGNILKKMKNFEGMSWGEILQRKTTSFVPINKFYPKARRRLEDIKMYDIDELLHLGLSGKERIWGKRIGRVFQVLWWDPNHTVLPVKKKHT